MDGPIDEERVRAAGVAARNPPGACYAFARSSIRHGQVGPIRTNGIGGVVVSIERVDRKSRLVIVWPAVDPHPSTEVHCFHDIHGLGCPIGEIGDPQFLAFSEAAVVLQLPCADPAKSGSAPFMPL